MICKGTTIPKIVWVLWHCIFLSKQLWSATEEVLKYNLCFTRIRVVPYIGELYLFLAQNNMICNWARTQYNLRFTSIRVVPFRGNVPFFGQKKYDLQLRNYPTSFVFYGSTRATIGALYLFLDKTNMICNWGTTQTSFVFYDNTRATIGILYLFLVEISIYNLQLRNYPVSFCVSLYYACYTLVYDIRYIGALYLFLAKISTICSWRTTAEVPNIVCVSQGPWPRLDHLLQTLACRCEILCRICMVQIQPSAPYRQR